MTLAEAVKTLRQYCEKNEKNECASCVFGVDGKFFWLCGLMKEAPCFWKTPTETNIYDEEEIHKNCTVQILRSSVTGEESVGWWEND